MTDLATSSSSSANISIQFQNNQPADAGISAPSPASASNMALLSESKVPDRPARRIVPLSCGVESLRGKRQTMEDKCTVLQHPMFSAQCKVPTDHANPRSFFAVYDGHGGEVCAEYCRRYLHGNMVIQDTFLRDPVQALRAAVVQTENNFQDAARKAHLESTSGTCAIIAYIECDQLIVANVGDSRAVLCSKGKAVGLSSDHKPGRPDERKRIEERGGAVARADHEAANPPSDFCFWLSNCCLCPCLYMGPLRVYPGGLAVSRSIGDVGLKNGSLIIADPEMTVHTITDKDEFLILACDGVWDVLTNQEAVAIVREALRSGKTASQASSVLAQRSIAKGSLDNVSTIVVVFAEEAVFARAPSANRS